MPNLERAWTVEDVHALPDDGNRYEVIDGELFVTPSPAWRHQAAVGEVYARLRDYVQAEKIGYALAAPADIIFSPRRLVQPDVFVVPSLNGRRPERFEDVGRLMVAVEVLSPSTARADRVRKRTLFREEGVPEYWIVDLDARAIERTTPSEARPEVLVDELIWRPEGAIHPLSIDIAAYFTEVLDG